MARLRVSRLLLMCLAMLLAVVAVGCTRSRELGNVLRVALREKYKSLDPAHGSEYYSNVMIERAYEGLYQYHYLKRPYTLEPWLAETMPEVSKDQKTYTIRLRKGVRFQDDKAFKATGGKGRELVAEDFIYSFRRIADPLIASPGWWAFDGKVVGLNEWRARAVESGKADYQAPIEGLTAPEPHTLVIKLTKPSALLLHVLTMPYATAVAREAVETYGKEFMQHPVGTGPFRLTHLLSNQVIWERNPTYRKVLYPTEGAAGDAEQGLLSDAGKPLPFIDKIIDDIVVEDVPAWLSFMKGEHDYLMRIPKDNAMAVFDVDHKPRAEFRAKGIRVLSELAAEFTYFCFNMEDPVVGGKKNLFLRRAMALAYDEAPTIEKFYLGLGVPAQSPIVPGVPGYDPKYRNPSRQYNLAEARELLAKAGHPGGEGIPELVYETTSGLTRRQLGEYFQRSMAELGIKVRINVSTWPELMGRIRKKQAQVFDISWLYDYPDAENGWQLLYSRNASPGSNEANYVNPEFDRLYEQVASMPDGPARNKLFVKMKEILAADVPWIIGVHRAETRLVHPWLGNYKIHAFDYNVEKYLRLDTEARKNALR